MLYALEMKKKHTVLLLINLALIIGFGARFLVQLNHEFIIYVGVTIFFLCLVFEREYNPDLKNLQGHLDSIC